MKNVLKLMPLVDEYDVEELRCQIERLFDSRVELKAEKIYSEFNTDKIAEIIVMSRKCKFDNVIKTCIIEIARRWSYGIIECLYLTDVPPSVITMILDLKAKKEANRPLNVNTVLFQKFKNGY